MNGIDLLLLSGWGHPASSMDVLAELLRRDHPEWTTHTLAIADIAPGETALEADHLARVVQRSARRCVVVGWSMGALVAVEAAARLGPRLAGLALLAGTARFCSAPDHPDGVPPANVRAMMAALRKRPESVVRRFIADAVSPAALDEPAFTARATAVLNTGVAALADQLAFLLRADARHQAGTVTCPVLLVHGRRDAIIPAGASTWLARALPCAQTVFLDEAGHDLPGVHVQETARILQRFLESLA